MSYLLHRSNNPHFVVPSNSAQKLIYLRLQRYLSRTWNTTIAGYNSVGRCSPLRETLRWFAVPVRGIFENYRDRLRCIDGHEWQRHLSTTWNTSCFCQFYHKINGFPVNFSKISLFEGDTTTSKFHEEIGAHRRWNPTHVGQLLELLHRIEDRQILQILANLPFKKE